MYVCMSLLITYLQFRKLHSCKLKGHSQYAYHCKNVVFILTIWETLQNANSIWIHNNYMKESVLNMFLYSYFEYLQLWLNFCMDESTSARSQNCPPPHPPTQRKKKPSLMRLQFRKLQTVNSRGPAETCKLYKFL